MAIEDLVRELAGRDSNSTEFRDCSKELAKRAFSPEPGAALRATSAIFSRLVEPWGDQFSRVGCAKYVSFFTEALYAEGSPVAKGLERLGYENSQALRDRYVAVSRRARADEYLPKSFTKIVVLSRVTLGADLAITRHILHAAREAFPQAEIEFAGPAKNADLIVRGLPFRHLDIGYDRHALLGDRLKSWLGLRSRIAATTRGRSDGESLVIDPDSRLTQLGLLPVTADRHYLFFESRTWGGNGKQALGTLAADWGRRQWGEIARNCPAQPPPHNRVRKPAGGPLAAVSFGTGGRDSKRLGDRFEDGLLDLLLRKGFRIALDYGFGPEEERLTDARAGNFRGTVGRLPGSLGGSDGPAALMTWKGSLSGFGDWIACADLYVGYDSAAAHLAAALGTPLIEVFSGAPSAKFVHRWTPCGSAPVRVVPAAASDAPAAVLARVNAELGALRGG
ncbi:MAG: hypothetical protein OXN89_21370 [Bryobacterales bacterium]|nr:hypothetical protein [Bryobacterales bacterium]